MAENGMIPDVLYQTAKTGTKEKGE